MKFSEKKAYLINNIISFNNQELLVLLENLPDIDVTSILIRYILRVEDGNSTVLNGITDIVDSIKRSRRYLSDRESVCRNTLSLIFEDDTLQSEYGSSSLTVFEKRSSQRKAVSMEVTLIRGDESLEEECIDISASGMFIKSEREFLRNEDVTVSMMIASNGVQSELTFESKVVRTPGNGIGIQFHSIDRKDRSRLEELLRNL